jgi:hypothetical protein
VRATSETREVGVRNNVATLATSVVPPDSVHVAASRNLAGHPDIDLTLDAISGPHGEDPEGTFVLDWVGHSAGHVTCLSVTGNTAFVGVRIDEPNTPPDATATPHLLFLFTDAGSPGVGRDTLTFGGSAGSVSCLEPFFPGGIPGISITGGEITIVDTP